MSNQPEPPQSDVRPRPVPPKSQPDTDDYIALAATFFIPGLGHVLRGQKNKGFAIIGVNLLTCGLVSWSMVGIAVVMLDLYRVLMAKKKREIGEWEVFPVEDLSPDDPGLGVLLGNIVDGVVEHAQMDPNSGGSHDTRELFGPGVGSSEIGGFGEPTRKGKVE